MTKMWNVWYVFSNYALNSTQIRTTWRIIRKKHTKTPNYAEHNENVTSQLNDHPFVQHLVTLKGSRLQMEHLDGTLFLNLYNIPIYFINVSQSINLSIIHVVFPVPDGILVDRGRVECTRTMNNLYIIIYVKKCTVYTNSVRVTLWLEI